VFEDFEEYKAAFAAPKTPQRTASSGLSTKEDAKSLPSSSSSRPAPRSNLTTTPPAPPGNRFLGKGEEGKKSLPQTKPTSTHPPSSSISSLRPRPSNSIFSEDTAPGIRKKLFESERPLFSIFRHSPLPQKLPCLQKTTPPPPLFLLGPPPVFMLSLLILVMERDPHLPPRFLHPH